MTVSGEEKTTSSDNLRERLLVSMLSHVPEHGWNLRVLSFAARAEGVNPSDAEQIFPDAQAMDFIRAFHDFAEARLEKDLQAHQPSLASLPVRGRVALGIRLRLTPWSEHRPALKAALGVMLNPVNTRDTFSMVSETVNRIWYHAGDRSVDFHFYSKRALLASAYMATVFHWLDDPSPEQSESFAFLERRLDRILRFGRWSRNLRGAVDGGVLKQFRSRLRTRVFSH